MSVSNLLERGVRWHEAQLPSTITVTLSDESTAAIPCTPNSLRSDPMELAEGGWTTRRILDVHVRKSAIPQGFTFEQDQVIPSVVQKGVPFDATFRVDSVNADFLGVLLTLSELR